MAFLAVEITRCADNFPFGHSSHSYLQSKERGPVISRETRICTKTSTGPKADLDEL